MAVVVVKVVAFTVRVLWLLRVFRARADRFFGLLGSGESQQEVVVVLCVSATRGTKKEGVGGCNPA